MSKLRIAIQKKGRLSDRSLELLQNCGIKVTNGERRLRSRAQNFPLEILYLRDDDIPRYVEQGVADTGILGENEVHEQSLDVTIVRKLGFARCSLQLAIPKESKYEDLQWFRNKRIATSYPQILRKFFQNAGIEVEIEEISGSVEIAPGIGLADGICDLVSTGSTLIMNGLMGVETVLKSEACLIASPQLGVTQTTLLEKLLFRLDAVQLSRQYKYILLNTPNESISAISEILPGMKSPTILPLGEPGWSSLHSVVNEDDFWPVIDRLREMGAEGILVVPIEKMFL